MVPTREHILKPMQRPDRVHDKINGTQQGKQDSKNQMS